MWENCCLYDIWRQLKTWAWTFVTSSDLLFELVSCGSDRYKTVMAVRHCNSTTYCGNLCPGCWMLSSLMLQITLHIHWFLVQSRIFSTLRVLNINWWQKAAITSDSIYLNFLNNKYNLLRGIIVKICVMNIL